METKWSGIAEKLEKYLRLQTFPIAFKLFEAIEEAELIDRIRKPDFKPTLCQATTLARRQGWTVLLTSEHLKSDYCASIIGLAHPPDYSKGTKMAGVWFETPEDSRLHQEGMHRIPAGKFKAGVLAPLKANKFDPDLIIVYGNPAQVVRLMTGLQWSNYEKQSFNFTGETSCVDLFGESFHANKVVVTIPCFGERRFGCAQDDEMAVGIPPVFIDKIMAGMEATERNGLRYPIPFFGAQVNTDEGLPEKYKRPLTS